MNTASNFEVVELLEFADQVLTLPGDGTILSEPKNGAANKQGDQDFAKGDGYGTNEGANREDAASPVTVEDSEPETNCRLRSEGDISLYTYYMKSVSVWVLFTWFFITAIVSVMERMPGKKEASLASVTNANRTHPRHLYSHLD